MKQISILLLGIFTFCITRNVSAQNQVTLSVGSNKILQADFSGTSVAKIEWQMNGKTISTSGSSRKGITVAGGHCIGDVNQLNSPNGVFVDKDDNVWVADASNGRIQKYAHGSTNGITIGADLPNAPTFPVNVFVSHNGSVYAADYFEGKVKLLVKGGKEWVNAAGQNNELDLVRGVWVDEKGNVYCTQYGFFFNGTFNLDGMVLKYPPNSSAFEIVAGHHGIGSALNQFSIPTSVVLDKHGNIYVADGTNDHGNQNSRVMKWAPGATEGVIVAGGNGEGEASNQCPYPVHVSLDHSGALYVSHFTSNKVTKWKPGATKGEVIAGGNGVGDAADQLVFPFGNFVKDNYLYVVDAGNNRVQRFDLTAHNLPRYFKPRHPGTYQAVASFEDGSVVESNSVIVPETKKQMISPGTSKFKPMAFPNPSKNFVTVNYDAVQSGQYLFELTNAEGKILMSKAMNTTRGYNSETIDISRFARGAYFIHLIQPDKMRESIKIIKE